MIDQKRELDLTSPIEFTNLPGSSLQDEHSAAQKLERFIAFYFGKNIYCVPADMVAEVIHPLSIAILPNSPRGVLGIAAIRGEVVAVLNLKELLQEEGGALQGKSKMIVLKPKDGLTQFAIPVDRMHEVVMLPADTFESNAGGNAADLVRRIEHNTSVYPAGWVAQLDEKVLIRLNIQIVPGGH